eukprot:jgi/Hompol1/94/HPOL_004487-RA
MAGIVVGAGLMFWAYTVGSAAQSQLAHNSLTTALLFHLRHDAVACAALGKNIRIVEASTSSSTLLPDPSSGSATATATAINTTPRGFANLMRGRAHLRIAVAGDRAVAALRFAGARIGGEASDANCWRSLRFDLHPLADLATADEVLDARDVLDVLDLSDHSHPSDSSDLSSRSLEKQKHKDLAALYPPLPRDLTLASSWSPLTSLAYFSSFFAFLSSSSSASSASLSSLPSISKPISFV